MFKVPESILKEIYGTNRLLAEEREALSVAKPKTINWLRSTVVALEALNIVQRHNHWEAHGESQYGDHQLFERLYKAAEEDMDSLAERVIGVLGMERYRLNEEIAKLMAQDLMQCAEYDDLVHRGQHAEQRVIDRAKRSIQLLKQDGVDATGLIEDLLPAIISKREESLYLLRQRG